ncbi:hypothetical protein QTP88_018209 [Uroleucon formosanum]
MGYTCCICKIGYTADSDVFLHKFSKDEILKRLWLDACCIKNVLPSHRICDKHFTKEITVPRKPIPIPIGKKINYNSTVLLYIVLNRNDYTNVIILYTTAVCLTGYHHSYSSGKTSLLV